MKKDILDLVDQREVIIQRDGIQVKTIIYSLKSNPQITFFTLDAVRSFFEEYEEKKGRKRGRE